MATSRNASAEHPTLTLVTALLITGAVLAGCGKDASRSAGTVGSDVTQTTRNANGAVAKAYDLGDAKTFDDAKRGLIAVPQGKVTDAGGKVLWDFDVFAFVKGAAPDSVNPSLWRQSLLNNHVGLFKVAEGIHQLRGFDNANITLIDGKTGWIVVDTLTARETAEFAMAFARKHLGEKKVSAVIFTHSHVDHFGGALGVISAEDVAARKIPVVVPNGFMEEATSENVLVGIAMGRRAAYMYGNRLERSPKGLVDIGLAKAVAFGSIGILPPNQFVTAAPQEMGIDGVRFVFYNAPGSEAPAEMTFYLPDHKAYCGAELAVQTMHNIYTLRGAKVRDAMKWAQYLDEARKQSAPAEVYFSQHHWPVWGAARINEFLTKQRDVLLYTHDQTVRMMNAGMTMREIAEEIKLPKSLDSFLNAHGYYGTLSHNAKAVYQFYLGWFDANPANLNPHPPVEAGKRYVALAGGPEKTVAAAQDAFDKGDYRWAAELLNHVVFAAPANTSARQLLARTYDQMGYTSESAPWRNFYLTGALELRDGPPKTGITSAALLDMLKHTPVERFLEAMAAGLNGSKAEDVNLKINLVFSDTKESYVLLLENAVL
ncbi:MAG: alkyl sulfatase dimerization domain-containing protein, partial [Usitatibacteraceae bacterium]